MYQPNDRLLTTTKNLSDFKECQVSWFICPENILKRGRKAIFFPPQSLVVGFVKSFVSGVTSGLLYATMADVDIAPLGFQARRVIKPLVLAAVHLGGRAFCSGSGGSVPGDADQVSQQS